MMLFHTHTHNPRYNTLLIACHGKCGELSRAEGEHDASTLLLATIGGMVLFLFSSSKSFQESSSKNHTSWLVNYYCILSVYFTLWNVNIFEVITSVLNMFDLYLNIFTVWLMCVVCERNVEHMSALSNMSKTCTVWYAIFHLSYTCDIRV